jgi:hypothetical protein
MRGGRSDCHTRRVSSSDPQTFCEALASIDDVVDEINSDGPVVVEKPSDMGAVLGTLGRKFDEVAEAAPDKELEDALRDAATMFLNGAARLNSNDPPVESVSDAVAIYEQAMGGVLEAGARVKAYREKHCDEGDTDSAAE